MSGRNKIAKIHWHCISVWSLFVFLFCFFKHFLSIYLPLLSRSFSDNHLRCCGWLNFEFSKREKYLGWVIKTIYKKLNRGMLKRILLHQ